MYIASLKVADGPVAFARWAAKHPHSDSPLTAALLHAQPHALQNHIPLAPLALLLPAAVKVTFQLGTLLQFQPKAAAAAVTRTPKKQVLAVRLEARHSRLIWQVSVSLYWRAESAARGSNLPARGLDSGSGPGSCSANTLAEKTDCRHDVSCTFYHIRVKCVLIGSIKACLKSNFKPIGQAIATVTLHLQHYMVDDDQTAKMLEQMKRVLASFLHNKLRYRNV